MVRWHDFGDLDYGSLMGAPSSRPQQAAAPKQRQSKVQKYAGLMADPVFGFQANPGTSWMRNPAPQGVNPHEWARQQDIYFGNKMRQEVYNKAYKKAFDGEMHLGNPWAVMPYSGGWVGKTHKSRFEFGENGRGLVQWTENEQRESPHLTQEIYHDLVISAIKQAQQDSKEYGDRLQKEKETWDTEDKSSARLEGIKREYERMVADTQRKAAEQARYQQAYNAASQARQARMANNGRQHFAADSNTGRASAAEAASAKLLSHRGLGNGQKLGSREKLGSKSLLGV